MLLDTLNATLIEKEAVGALHFPTSDVLEIPEKQRERLRKLRRATFLGNIEHTKIRILFEDDQGPKVVHTTIWATGGQNIVLKYGLTIPIRRIHDVKI